MSADVDIRVQSDELSHEREWNGGEGEWVSREEEGGRERERRKMRRGHKQKQRETQRERAC